MRQINVTDTKIQSCLIEGCTKYKLLKGQLTIFIQSKQTMIVEIGQHRLSDMLIGPEHRPVFVLSG